MQSSIETLFDVECGATHWNVFPFRRQTIVTFECARSPNHVAVNPKLAQAIDGVYIEVAVFQVSEDELEAGYAAQARVEYQKAFAMATAHNPPAAFVRRVVRGKIDPAAIRSNR